MCIPPLCYGTPVTGQVSTSDQNVNHSYASTSPGGQSGIFAGKGGYDIEAKGGVELEGGAIVSQAPKQDNRLVAPSITYKDVVNHNDTSASSSSLSLGYGGGSAASTAFDNLTNNTLGNAFNGAGLPDDQHQTSVTQSVISPGNRRCVYMAALSSDEFRSWGERRPTELAPQPSSLNRPKLPSVGKFIPDTGRKKVLKKSCIRLRKLGSRELVH